MLALTDSPLLKVRPGLLTELVPTISLSTNESLQVFATNPQLRTSPLLSQILDCPWWEVSKYSDSQVALSLKPWILRQVGAPKEFIIRRTVCGDRKERITSPIVATDAILVLSFFDCTLIALLTRIEPLFWPI